MRRLVTTEEMRAMDREVIEHRDIPAYDLMDAAGLGVAETILDQYQDLEDARVVVLAGGGNNGGDGFVVARYLKKAEARPLVVLVGKAPGDLAGEVARAFREWQEAGGETTAVTDEAGWQQAWPEVVQAELLVDAMLGTGSRGAPEGITALVVEAMEHADVPVVAVDIPTGVNADTGSVEGACIHADLTVTMALPKRGHFFYPGRGFAGDLHWVDIGFPPDIEEMGEGLRVYVTEPEDVAEWLPDRDPEMHKGDRGRLLLVGGSAGMTGAVALACRAAVRAGAGLVTAGIPHSLNDILEIKLTEAMTLPLPQLEARALSRDAFDAIALHQPGRVAALAVGPGMGRHSSTQALVQRLVADIDLPMVLDADGLYAFAGKPDLLRMNSDPARLVLTPHVGEFAALTGESAEDIQQHRIELASKYARRWGVVICLKGAPTVIADPGEQRVLVNPTGSEALATGGTGDVLTGLIAGFLSQGLDPFEAAALGAYLHGWTADCIVDEWGSPYGLNAGDLIDTFPLAVGWLLHPSDPWAGDDRDHEHDH